MLFWKGLCCLLIFFVKDGRTYSIFDAEPLLGRDRKINLTLEILEEILNVDTGRGDYKPLTFQYEHDQYLGQHGSKDDGTRCYNDHVRCVTTLMATSRPVCGIATDGKTNDFGSMCDLYLDNCKRRIGYWRVVDSGKCVRAKKITYYDYGEAEVPNGRR